MRRQFICENTASWCEDSRCKQGRCALDGNQTLPEKDSRSKEQAIVRTVDTEALEARIRKEKERLARKFVAREEKKRKRRFQERYRIALIVQLLNDPRIERMAREHLK